MSDAEVIDRPTSKSISSDESGEKKKPDLVPAETKPHYWLYKQGREVWNRWAREAFIDENGNDDWRIDSLILDTKKKLAEVEISSYYNKNNSIIELKRKIEILNEFKDYKALTCCERNELIKNIRNESKNYNFNLPTVNKIIDLSSTIWTQKADFSGFIFYGECNFSLSQFKSVADFSSTCFLTNVHFNGVIFNDKARFHSSYFSSKISFRGASFLVVANFRSSVLYNSDFFNARFFISHFNLVSFNFESNFRLSKFKSGVDFISANFKGTSNFSDVHFHGFVDLSSANFERAIFRNTNFEYANFSYTAFNNADFELSNFNDIANFKYALFKLKANFQKACFKKKAEFNFACLLMGNFSSASFLSDLDFTNVEFDFLLLHKTKFEGDGNFEKATFKQVPKVSGVNILGVFNFNEVTWPRIDESQNPVNDALSYSQLKRLMDDSSLHHMEIFFFRKELLCRKEAARRKSEQISKDKISKIRKDYRVFKVLNSSKLTSWVLKFKIFDSNWRESQFINVYDKVCECGDSITRPLRKLFILYLTMAFLYPVISGQMSNGIFQGFYLSLRHSVLFLPASKTNYEAVMHKMFDGVYGEGKFDIMYMIYVLSSGLQTILSIGLLFLVGLAVRNHLRIK